jgi:16S rRNA (cytosine967-C5)-methyltransferase
VGGTSGPRVAAARAVNAVSAQGRNLDRAFEDAAAGLRGRDRALARALAFGAVRGLPRYARVSSRLLSKPLKAADAVLGDLLAVGLFQLDEMRVPAHAAVKETVAATRRLGKPAASGLINAVLRRYQRERETLIRSLETDPVYRWAHPRWMIDRIAADWPEDWETVLAENNRQAPMWLRANRLRGTPADWIARYAACGGEAARGPAPDSLRLGRPADVEELPGFRDGHVSVQDAAAQFAAGLLGPRPGERILDACAAPGGKTGHLLEMAPDARVTALDADEARAARITDNLARLGLDARVVVADAARPETWHDGELFDRILLDAPCSGTGVIRRHPDIKLLRRAEDLAGLAATQDRLLDALWRLLSPGGRLVYCTCSVVREENALRVAAFVERHSNASIVPLPGPWGREDGPGRQILPGETGMDGFYYACLNKSKSGPTA